MSKVIVRIFGGIGNQLFCYAAARRLAYENQAELVIDDVSGFTKDYKYKRNYQLDFFSIPCRKATYFERFNPLSFIRRPFVRLYNSIRPYSKRSYIKQNGVAYDNRLKNIHVYKNIYLEGYWQSEQYFNDIEGIIRSDLIINAQIDKKNLKLAQIIDSSISIAIHVRFFSNIINNVTRKYYIDAIDLMKKKFPKAQYFIFSDNLDLAKVIFEQQEIHCTFVCHNTNGSDQLDFWLMSRCKNFIIANSTFSWWSAWLSKNKDKVVIAPKGILQGTSKITSWGFDGLLPESWIKL